MNKLSCFIQDYIQLKNISNIAKKPIFKNELITCVILNVIYPELKPSRNLDF